MPVGDVANINDTPIGTGDYRPPVSPLVTPIDGDILTYNAEHKAYYPSPGVQTNGFRIDDLGGTQDPAGAADDLNNTDFTGQEPIIGTAAHIVKASFNTFVHRDLAYTWLGPTAVTVGLGGTHTALAADLTGVGTADHSVMSNRDSADQHPTSAITGLDADQTTQDAATALVQSNLDTTNTNVQALDVRVTQNESDISTNATNISSNDVDIAANAAEIIRVQGELDVDEAALAAHLADTSVECHDQYATEVAALNTFALAGYGGISIAAPVAMADIGATWTTITGFDTEILTPRYVVHDLANNALRVQKEGVWQVSVKVTLTFAEGQGGRTISLRLYNATTAAPTAVPFQFFVGRNSAGANLSFVINGEFPQETENDIIVLQVSSVDSYTLVENIGTIFQMHHVSEAKSLTG